ncbi:hypothetical protein COT12_02155 [Candidatus Berkelbacteria bacterium CG08_land_8_20_14_0_20_39_8]|uniref:Carbohydrate kinase PfkB domain-containing protein n=1 Tax=Candidatus Berkelbacteria bacterium CG08_land_8_20_14_0_20_39_8 TaxID=1974511 RepID=A0A2M6YBZ6_9BACT|nr:MAG: hypothetical protein COT12_02155 [Candidatus Berkelbacteria bacterium CG08_land_8_20_14_0_20_39_8]
MYDVVTIGDAFLDFYIFSNDFKVQNDRGFKSGKSLSFDYGAKIDVEKIEYHTGGSAVNAAICFAKNELSASILSFAGDDSAAKKIIGRIEECGVSAELLKHDAQPTNTSIIISCHGDRTILAYHGERDYNDLTLAKNLKTGWFYLAPIKENSAILENKIIEHIAKNGSGLVWNPGPPQIKEGVKKNKHLLHLCNILILNREEALDFSGCGKTTIEDCLKNLYDFGPKLVVVTNGKAGAKAFDGEVFYQIDSSPDERIDATGAGDSFASALASKIILESDGVKAQSFFPEREVILEALKWGIVTSGLVVGKVGANSGLVSKSEIVEKSENLVKLEAKVYS